MSDETRYDADLGPLLGQPEAARFLDTSEHTLEYWRRPEVDKGPPYIRVGGNIKYPAKWLKAWLLKNAHCPDGDCPMGTKGGGQ